MAKRQELYKNAPIVEAIIDLRVILPEGTRVESLREIGSTLPSSYAEPKDYFEGIAQFELSSSSAITRAERAHRGYRFDRADMKRVLMVSLNGFSYSILPPYDRWESFRGEAKPLWDRYREICGPSLVTRAAVRYINRIDIPLPAVGPDGSLRLEDYFRTFPQVTEELTHHAMAEFIVQVRVPQPDLDSILMINQAVVPPPRPGIYSVMLDLDLYRTAQWDPGDDPLVWGFLDQLRDRKNEAFEASITENTREIFR